MTTREGRSRYAIRGLRSAPLAQLLHHAMGHDPLAFDLYPLLRRQSWLDRFSGHSIYRETRCQELVEALWAHQESPWYQRINMLGETKDSREYKGPSVTQASWIRSLLSTFVKNWEGSGTRVLGGLFGAPAASDQPVLPWNRAMQAAVLIYSGRALRDEVAASKAKWARDLRQYEDAELFPGDDAAFYGEYSLLSTDQGIRGFLFVLNDFCFWKGDQLKLGEWSWDDVQGTKKGKTTTEQAAATDEVYVSAALKSFEKTDAADFIGDIAKACASYDWRTSSFPELNDNERVRQSIFRGSSGYREMRRGLIEHISAQKSRIAQTAIEVSRVLGFDE